jgi:hypothetical protein
MTSTGLTMSGQSSGPGEAVNVLVQKVRRVGQVFTNFRQLLTPPATAMRRHMASSTSKQNPRLQPRAGGVKPYFLASAGTPWRLFAMVSRNHRAGERGLL